jgi:tetratricopeptide (TPR) repeat protein
MKKWVFIALLTATQAFAGADLLLQQAGVSAESDKPAVVVQKQLTLDDPFLVQFYGSWRAAGQLDFEVNSWANLVIEKKYEKAAHLLTVIRKKVSDKFQNAVDGAALYLYWKLDLPQTFFNEWLKISSNKNFLNSQMGIAIDQIISPNASQWLIDNGIQVSENHRIQLKSIREEQSRFNYSVQAWSALRSGKQSLEWIGKLSAKDPLRFYLAQSVVVEYARERKLGDAARLLKQVYEPQLAENGDVEQISSYYMLLARLLYQAGAMDAAQSYYQLIPQESSQFIQARVENMWISLRKNDMPKLKGELASLELDLFADKFLPEIYLVSSIAQLKLCQFEDVKKSFDSFISDNKKWSKKINTNIAKEDPAVVDQSDFYLRTVNNAIKSQQKEEQKLVKLAAESVEAVVPAIGVQKHWKVANDNIVVAKNLMNKNKTNELRRRWVNRKQILDSAIRKMRFVKVEFISMMRRFASKVKQKSDRVTTYKAAPKRKGQIEFPFDGVVWGDELFNMTAEVRSLCLGEGK